MKYVLATLLLLDAGSVFADDMFIQRDIAYTEPKNERQTLDVYAPTKGKNHPVVFWIHGGGWQAGDKTSVQVKPQAFVDKGFVFATTNYRLLPNVTIKEMAGDVAKSIRWIHDHGKDYGGDPNRMFVMGHSAGAQLAALVCTDDRYLKAEGLSPSIIKGCVPVDGDTYDVPMQIATVEERIANIYRRKFGDEKSQQDLSPVTHVAKDRYIPPFLILHVAEHPETKGQSQRLAKALQEVGVSAKAYPAKGKDHTSINADLGLPDDEPTKAVFEFVKLTFKNDQNAQTDKEILQGTWEYVSAIRGGKPYETPIGVQITFAGDNISRKIERKTHKHKYRIDPNETPKQISLIAMKDGEENVSTGIYCLEGDTLQWCFNLPGKPIPKTLASKEGDELTLCVLKRVVASQNRPVSSIPMPDESVVELTIQHEGDTYKLVVGNLYKVADSTDRLVFVDKIYDKDFREKNYAIVEGRVYRKNTDKGKMYPTRRHFAEGFEGAEQIGDLIGLERGWTTFTLQSPMAPSIPKYNQLRNHILRDGADFLDNRVEPSSEVIHSGTKALKCCSEPPSPQMTTAKASLSTTLLYFEKGDDVWFSGWYYVAEGGMPFTVMDLECTHFKEHPGMRIMVGQDGYVRFELKWAKKPMYRQSREKRVPLPTGRWVHLKSRLKLSEAADGVIQLWQDGVKLIDEHGQTLPLANAIYDSLEIGISAHSFGPDAATLFVDDVVISDKPTE